MYYWRQTHFARKKDVAKSGYKQNCIQDKKLKFPIIVQRGKNPGPVLLITGRHSWEWKLTVSRDYFAN